MSGDYETLEINQPKISYFKKRSERVKITKRRSDFNLFVFHFSSSAMQKIRNIFLIPERYRLEYL